MLSIYKKIKLEYGMNGQMKKGIWDQYMANNGGNGNLMMEK